MKTSVRSRIPKGVFLWLGTGMLLIGVIVIFTTYIKRDEQLGIVSASTPQLPAARVLSERLRQRGVPVKELRVIKEAPLQIEITLQSASDNDKQMEDDLWSETIAAHEATMAHRLGFPMASFTILSVNRNGKVIAKGTTFLQPSDRSQMLPTPMPGNTDRAAITTMLRQQFRPEAMYLESLTATPYDPGEKEGVVVQARVRADTPSVDSVNANLAQLIWAFRLALSEVNSATRANIILGRLIVIGTNGQRLAEYIWDVEEGSQRAFFGDGIQRLHGVGSPFQSPLPTPPLKAASTAIPMLTPTTRAPFTSPLASPTP